MTEYTLVFRRPKRSAAHPRTSRCAWVVARPATPTAGASGLALGRTGAAEMAEVFVVPICSALGLDGVAYEHFLVESGVLEAALGLLGAASLERPGAAVTARKEVQALVMAAEVQHIVDGMSA